MKNGIKLVEEPCEKLVPIYKNIDGLLGMVPNIFKGLANSPAVLKGYLAFNQELSEGILCPRLRESIAITVASLNGCQYCASAHSALGKKAGISAEELALNLEGKSGNEKVQAAINFTKAVVENRGQICEATLNSIRESGFEDGEIVEMIAVISMNIFTNYFNHIAGTEVDFPAVCLTEQCAV